MLLQLCTWQEVESYLERSRGIIVPIGSTEQHGPNGLIGTDAICPEVIAKGVSEKIDTIIAPTISIGMAQHHLAFPGSLTLRPATLIAVITDIVMSLANHGFERIYFLNGHGGNIATVQAAFSECYAQQTFAAASSERDLRLKLTNWYFAPSVQQISKKLFGSSEGSHATPSEVSLSYFAYPQHVKDVPMHPLIAPNGPIRNAHDYRRRFPDGRIGSNPALASIAAGEQLYNGCVADIIDSYASFMGEE